MQPSTRRFILGSRSPRRFELLRLLVPAESIQVLPPATPHESSFDGLHDWNAIRRRLTEIAADKCADVLAQLDNADRDAVVITADTVIVVDDANGRQLVLGQPPDDDAWRDVVREWFERYYLGRSHTAATAFCAAVPGGRRIDGVVTTQVAFSPADSQTESLIEWYLDTGEPRGKAGGYALQGAGSVFVSAVEGSVSNVVGLPLRELLQAFRDLGIDVNAGNH